MNKTQVEATVVVAVTSLIIMLLTVGCAKNLPPPGGPADLDPPTLVMTHPVSGTTGVALDEEISLRFSERINESSVGQALFISPPLKTPPRLQTKGDQLVIKPEQPLDSGRTYVVSVAASLQDLHGNRLVNSISFAFSTGDVIDSAGIRGIVYRDFIPLRNFRVFAWEYSDTLLDSIFSMVPDYVTESGDSGDFRIEFMSPGEYLVLAAEDKDRNNLINRAGEQIAIPVSLATASREIGSVTLHLTSFDSTSLELINCAGIVGAVKLRLDSGLDSVSARHAEIEIRSTDTSFALPSLWHESASSELSAFSDWFTLDREFDLSVAGLKGQTGREFPGDTVNCFVRIAKRDDEPPRVLRHHPSPRTQILPQETLSVIFSEPVTVAPNAIVLEMDTTMRGSTPLETRVLETISPFESGATTLGFTLPEQFERGRKFKATLDLTGVTDLFGNSPVDSIYSFSFQTADPDSFGTLSGQLSGETEHLVIELVGTAHRFHYKKTPINDSSYSWTLYPDNYRITAYLDQNRDGRWNLGRLIPFEFAEPGWLADDSVRVRARFEHEGKVLRFE